MQAAIGKSDPRMDPRSNVFLIATCSAEDSTQPVKVRNLSVHGALLEGQGLPAEGATVSLRRGSLGVAGVVAWRDETHCGVRFNRPIDVEHWVRRIGSQGQQKVDAAIADLRGGLATYDRINPRVVDDVITSASAQLLEICERIAALPGMSIGLAEELVRIDAIAHSLKCGR